MVDQLKETVEDWKDSLNYVDLTGADLTGADLMEANLSGAKLLGAKFMKANLRGADLKGAYLTGASGLTVNQLCKAKTLRKCIIDEKFEKEVKEKCPKLLEEPKELE